MDYMFYLDIMWILLYNNKCRGKSAERTASSLSCCILIKTKEKQNENTLTYREKSAIIGIVGEML